MDIGGAQTGIDMLAMYIKKHFNPALVAFAMGLEILRSGSRNIQRLDDVF